MGGGHLCFSFPRSDLCLPLSCLPLGFDGRAGHGWRWRRRWCSFVNGHPVLGGTPCSGLHPRVRAESSVLSSSFLRKAIMARQVFSETSNYRSQLKAPVPPSGDSSCERLVADTLVGKKKKNPEVDERTWQLPFGFLFHHRFCTLGCFLLFFISSLLLFLLLSFPLSFLLLSPSHQRSC